MRNLFAAICAAATLFSGCASYQPTPAAFHEGLGGPYHLDSGDRVRITVFEETSLTNSYAVDQAGFLSVPLVGQLPARGQTTSQIQTALAARLANGFIRDPDVSVEVDQYRPFFIMGEVQSGGQYAYVPGMTVQSAIAAAGGFSTRANQGTVDITRQVSGQVITGRVVTSDPIVPGDTIYVRERLI